MGRAGAAAGGRTGEKDEEAVSQVHVPGLWLAVV